VSWPARAWPWVRGALALYVIVAGFTFATTIALIGGYAGWFSVFSPLNVGMQLGAFAAVLSLGLRPKHPAELELIGLIAVAIAAVVVTVLLSLARRWHEAVLLRRPPPAPPDRPDAPAWIDPFVLIVAAAGIVIAGRLPGARPAVLLWGSVSMLAAGVAAVLIAGHLHRLPNCRRTRKYRWLMSGVLLCWAAGWTFMLPADYSGRLLPLDRDAHVRLWVPVLCYVAAGAAAAVLARRGPDGVVRFVRRLAVAWSIPLFAVSAFIFLGPLVVLVLSLRLHTAARLGRHPIVYLRSFHYEGAPRVFARVVAPAASVHGIVVALVHQTQPGADLQARVHPMQQAAVFTVADEVWRGWVTRQLSIASAAILDRTVGTDSVAWEETEARRLLPPAQILVIERGGASPEAHAGPALRYRDHWPYAWPSRWRLRRALAAAIRAHRAAELSGERSR
jgi:hypothetical protein